MNKFVRWILIPFVLSLAFGIAIAQNTTVTGTVTDSDSIAWANGSITFNLIGSGGPYYCSGTKMLSADISKTYSLNGSGAFSGSVCSNSNITPVSSQWQMVIQPAATAFSQIMPPTQITGGSQSLTSYIGTNIKPIRITVAFGTRAYGDIEIVNPPVGGTYFNLTTLVNRTWTGTSWISGGGGNNSITLENTYSAGGAFNFAHNLNSLYNQVACVTRSGGGFAPATFTYFPVSVNAETITVPSAGDYICTFSVGGILPPDFSVAVSPTSLNYSIVGTGTQNPTFTVNQTALNGFTGAATYSVTGLASGMTGAFSPTSISGTGSSTLTLSFPATQSAATTTFTVTGTDGALVHSVNPSITVQPASLISAWPMNEGSGLTLHDVSSNSNNVTIASSSDITWQANAGFPGTTTLWNGVAGAPATSTTLTNFTGATPFSLSAWIKTSATTEQGILSTLNGLGGFQGWEMELTPTTGFLNFFVINSNPSNQIEVHGSTDLIGAGLKYVVATYDGSKTAAGVKLYVNGVLETPTVTTDALTGSAANGIAAHVGSRIDGTSPFNGVEAFAEIYNAVLTQSQITANFTAGPGIH